MLHVTNRVLGAACVALASGTAFAGVSGPTHVANFTALNNSGVEAIAFLTLDTDAMTLTVDFNATGVEDVSGIDGVHPLHIHGLGADSPGGAGDPLTLGPALDSQTPTMDDDTDGDGFIEVAEGLPRYGNVLLSLDSDGGNGTFSDGAGGVISFVETYDLTDNSVFGDPLNPDLQITGDDLMPLDFREIVLHGLTLEEGDGSPDSGIPINEADGTPGYKPILPIAAAEIEVIPSPGAATVLALAGFGAVRRRRA